MLRTPMALCGGTLLLAIVAAAPVQADELPIRKAGLWETKNSTAGATTRLCVDAAFEKTNGMLMMEKEMCSKLDIRKTANGYTVDAAECNVVAGMVVTSRSEISGDFNSAYTVTVTSRTQGGLAGKEISETITTIQAKWLGACPADWKPGDIELPGGKKINLM